MLVLIFYGCAYIIGTASVQSQALESYADDNW